MTPSNAQLRIVEDETQLAHALTEEFIGAARTAIDARGVFHVALAGGSTPKATYALLASEAYRTQVAWDAVRFFFGDERCVGPESDESNYRMVYQTLFAPLTVSGTHIFRMRGEDEPKTAAAAYAEVLSRELGPEPIFDLIMLGMGPDGHTASLFPGTLPVAPQGTLVAAPFVEKFGTHRLTLTPQVLTHARAVVVATAGTAKADALAHALASEGDVNMYPIRLLNAGPAPVTWLVDRAATQGLPS